MTLLADLPRSSKVAAVLGLASVLIGGVALSVGPLVRARLGAVAERRGFQVEVQRVRLGAGAIWLKDVDLSAPLVPGLALHVNAVRIGFGWHFGVSEVAIHGAALQMKGEIDELQRQVAAYQAQRRPESLTKGDSTREVHYVADGVDVSWRRRPAEPEQRIWALRYERQGPFEDVALGLVRLRDELGELESRQVHVRLRRGSDEGEASSPEAPRRLLSLHADGLDLGIALSPAVPRASPAHPDDVPRPSPAHPEHPEHPDNARSFRADPLRGPKLRVGLSELSALLARLVPPGASLTLEGVRLCFRQGTDALNFGPSTLRAVREAAQLVLSLSPKPEASGTPLEFKVSLPIAADEVRAELHGGPVSLHSLGVREGDFGLRDVEQATLKASLDVTLARDGSSLAFVGNGVLDRVSLQRAELSSSALSGIRLAVRARGTTTLDGAQLKLEESELSLGDVRVQGSGSLIRSAHSLQTHWSGGVPLASCQAFLDATPRGLAPLITSLRMSGTFAVQAQLDYDSDHPNETRVRLNVANDCRIEQIPAELTPRRFEAFWRREVKGPDKRPLEIESGPGSADWVPYDAISPFMETAVLVCEDGHFPYHHGFDFEAMQNSIRDNLIKGRFARGASTISMQLAKNLYLGKEKTLSRKLQEAVLTQLLEQELSKRELLELYLNVIEYAPGIYGIGPAARYYFAERPSDLSLAQALYIASILPNPERQHFEPDGKVSLSWTKYLQRLMHIARKIGRISDDQLTVGLSERVAFHVADSGSGAFAVSPSLAEGNDTPSELSP